MTWLRTLLADIPPPEPPVQEVVQGDRPISWVLISAAAVGIVALAFVVIRRRNGDG